MSVKVRIPTPLRGLTNGKGEVEGEGGSVQELIENLEKSYSGLRDRICDETGNIRRFINVYVNEEDIRFLQGTSTPLKAGDLVSIVPAIAGGSGDARRPAPEVAVLGVEHRVSRQQSLPRAAATRTDAGTSEQA